MADRRRQEIEEKRAKLAELRRARDERKALLSAAESAAPGPSSSQQQPLTTARKDVNDLVDSLLQRPSSPYTGRSTPQPPGTAAASVRAPSALGYTGTSAQTDQAPDRSIPPTPSGRNSQLSEASQHRDRDRVVSGLSYVLDAQRDGAGSPFPSTSAVDYVDHSAELYELPQPKPKPIAITYSKSTQTNSVSTSTSMSDLESESDSENQPSGSSSRRKRKGDKGNGGETEEEMRKRILEEIEAERSALQQEIDELKEREDKLPDLSNEQKQAIFTAPDFEAFIEESTRIVQRALSDGYDYIRDYTIGLDGAFQKVKLVCTFQDERWTAGRSVTDLDWSSKFPELIAASYNKNSGSPGDPDGIVAVWNLHLLERPEFIFHSPSDMLSVTFSPYHPTLIFGGSYSGQVLLWDTRAKHLPVLKTPLSASGHTYPVYSMKMVGTLNANSLISASTDGMVCSWLTDMLAQPQEALSLAVPNPSKTDEISVTTFDFPSSETATFWVGSEEGSIYQANRYDQPSRKAGISPQAEDVYRGHAGPITGLHFHPSTGSIDFGDLFLSTSMDWSTKLWRARNNVKAATQAAPPSSSRNRTVSGQQEKAAREAAAQTPLYSFESSDDYVFDAKWHPHHPAMFGSVDGTGKFDLWNLNQDFEVSSRALNKLAWDRTTQSRKVALGGADGKVYVYDVAEKMVVPRDSEWTDFQRVIAGMAGGQGGHLGLVSGM